MAMAPMVSKGRHCHTLVTWWKEGFIAKVSLEYEDYFICLKIINISDKYEEYRYVRKYPWIVAVRLL